MSSLSALNSLLSSGGSSSNSNLDISNILAAVAGANTPGIDVTSAVSAAIYADQAPERIWQAEQSTLSTQMNSLQAIQSATSSLQTDMQSLNSLTGPLSARTTTSSNTSAVTASAASGTSTGSHSVSVANLATTASWYSSETSNSTTLSPGSITITDAAGNPNTINIGSGTDTLSSLVSNINSLGLGVKASLVTDANGARLSLVSNTSGNAADFSVSSSDSDLSFTRAQTAQNASLTVDGVPVSSATNTVTGAISGVTLNLLSTTASSGPANLTVASNTLQISTAINQFVSDYNSAVSLVNAQFTYSTSTASEGALGSDPTIRSLQQMLGGIATYTSASSSGVSSLSDLGISVGSDGTLSVDSSRLSSVLNTDPSDVQTFLQGSALNGFANAANNNLDAFTDPSDGAFTVDINSFTTQNTSLQNEISDFETNYIAQQRTVLTSEYTSAEEALQSLPTTMSQIQTELGNNSNNG